MFNSEGFYILLILIGNCWSRGVKEIHCSCFVLSKKIRYHL